MRIILFVVTLLLAGTAFAEVAPDAMVREILAKIKETGNPAVIVDHVDWPEAFKSMPEPDKYQLKIKTPDDMKEFFRQMLANPSATMKRNMLERVASLPADKQEQAKAAVEKMSDQMVAKEAELKQRIQDTEYTVGDTKVQGDKATVVLAQSYKGEKTEETIELRKKDGQWLLPSVKMGSPAAPGGKPQPTAAPAAKAAPAKSK